MSLDTLCHNIQNITKANKMLLSKMKRYNLQQSIVVIHILNVLCNRIDLKLLFLSFIENSHSFLIQNQYFISSLQRNKIKMMNYTLLWFPYDWLDNTMDYVFHKMSFNQNGNLSSHNVSSQEDNATVWFNPLVFNKFQFYHREN